MVTRKYFKKKQYNVKYPKDMIKLKASTIFLNNKDICDITMLVSGEKSENWSQITVICGMNESKEVGTQQK